MIKFCCCLFNNNKLDGNLTVQPQPGFSSRNSYVPSLVSSSPHLLIRSENICKKHHLNLEHYYINSPNKKLFYCSKCLEAFQHASELTDRVNNFLLERYIFKEYLGKGSSGRVFSVVKPNRDNEVYALKVIDLTYLINDGEKRDSVDIQNYKDNVMREIELHKKLNHQNIIKFYDFEWLTNQLHLAILMEKAECSLDTLRDLEKNEILMIFQQICEGVHYLHQNNIIHRDLKMKNILIQTLQNNQRQVKICDFGGSKQQFPYDSKTSNFQGTTEYLAPEVLKDVRNFSSASDIWALGIILYKLIARNIFKKWSHPFDGNKQNINRETQAKIRVDNIMANLYQPLNPMRFSSEESIITKCLDPNPKSRIPIENLLEYLNQLLNLDKVEKNKEEESDNRCVSCCLSNRKLKASLEKEEFKHSFSSEENKENNNPSFKPYNPDNYVVLELVAKNKYGRVFKAFDKKLEKFVALKFVKLPNNNEVGSICYSEYSGCFDYGYDYDVFDYYNEADILQKIKQVDSPMLITFYDTFQNENKQLVFEMELGQCSLSEVISHRRKYPENELFYIVYDLAKQLHVAKANHIYHGDVKLDDIIIIMEKNRPIFKLIDFGFGKYVPNDKLSSALVRGYSYIYASPEIKRIKNEEYAFDFDPYQSDIYSLGVVMMKLMGLSNDEIESYQKTSKFSSEIQGDYPKTCLIIAELLKENPCERQSIEKLRKSIEKKGKIQIKQPNDTLIIETIQQKNSNQMNDLELKNYVDLYSSMKNLKEAKKYCTIAAFNSKKNKNKIAEISWKVKCGEFELEMRELLKAEKTFLKALSMIGNETTEINLLEIKIYITQKQIEVQKLKSKLSDSNKSQN